MEKFIYKKFSDINLNDSFFDSLKNDYKEFSDWFSRKSNNNESAYVQTIDGEIGGFLYLKIEDGPIEDISPIINCKQAVKIGTMKINPHGTRLGERFIKKALDFAINNNIKIIYVTVFDKHEALINLYKKYGFKKYAIKTSDNGTENVLVKNLSINHNDFMKNYPKVNINSKAYSLSILPEYHTKLFPDSILKNESFDVVKDISHTNSIEKIYICKMRGVSNLKLGDLLVIYRTTDIQGQARFRSVVTSLCTVEAINSTRDFSNYIEFKNHCKNYSIFDETSLRYFYNSRAEYYVIKMTYNIAFNKRLTNGYLQDEVGINPPYWGFFELTPSQLNQILKDAKINENYFL